MTNPIYDNKQNAFYHNYVFTSYDNMPFTLTFNSLNTELPVGTVLYDVFPLHHHALNFYQNCLITTKHVNINPSFNSRRLNLILIDPHAEVEIAILILFEGLLR